MSISSMNIFNKLKSTKRLFISTTNICAKTSFRCIATKSSSNNNENSYSTLSSSIKLLLLASLTATSVASCDDSNTNNTKKIYRMTEISTHKTKDVGVWVTFEDGVYDITKFIINHPGGQEKIILAAGGPVEPFWRVYQQHYNSKLPVDLLKPMRIGTLHPDDYKALQEAGKKDLSDPYNEDPPISPVLNAYSLKPINAEAPSTLLATPYVTPKDLWFVRNHHPVPVTKHEDMNNLDGLYNFDENYKITISGLGVQGNSMTLSLKDLKKFPKYNITVTTQCGGNRRSEMTPYGKTAGIQWGISAMSTANWGGAKLCDVLKSIGLDADAAIKEGIVHVQFAGTEGMEASIPARKAFSTYGDVLLAYEMNGEDVPASHGYPIRAVVPGHVGVRSVKWLEKITLSHEEAHGPWQRGMAYKGFGPSIQTLDGIDCEKIPSLQEQPVQSMITYPKIGSEVHPGPMTLRGISYSGGGRGIIRVDISIDGGENWTTAELGEGKDQSLDSAWAWTLWEADVIVPEELVNKGITFICKATDASYNVQPDTIKGIWNLRGINNNAWHRVLAKVVPEPEEEDDE